MASFAVVRNTNMSLISAIRNLVCPLCGGSMMGFRCLGRCRSDCRQVWERAMRWDQRMKHRVLGSRASSIECRQSGPRRRDLRMSSSTTFIVRCPSAISGCA